MKVTRVLTAAVLGLCSLVPASVWAQAPSPGVVRTLTAWSTGARKIVSALDGIGVETLRTQDPAALLALLQSTSSDAEIARLVSAYAHEEPMLRGALTGGEAPLSSYQYRKVALVLGRLRDSQSQLGIGAAERMCGAEDNPLSPVAEAASLVGGDADTGLGDVLRTRHQAITAMTVSLPAGYGQQVMNRLAPGGVAGPHNYILRDPRVPQLAEQGSQALTQALGPDVSAAPLQGLIDDIAARVSDAMGESLHVSSAIVYPARDYSLFWDNPLDPMAADRVHVVVPLTPEAAVRWGYLTPQWVMPGDAAVAGPGQAVVLKLSDTNTRARAGAIDFPESGPFGWLWVSLK